MGRWALSDGHYCIGFSCSKTNLDRFLVHRALRESRRDLNKTYVVCGEEEDGVRPVIGYYTVCSNSISRDAIPIARPENYRSLPVLHLARLAVSVDEQGAGLGHFLLLDAFARCVNMADQIGILGMDVLAGDDEAKQWYLRRGFQVIHEMSMMEGGDAYHLFMHIGTIRATLSGGS